MPSAKSFSNLPSHSPAAKTLYASAPAKCPAEISPRPPYTAAVSANAAPEHYRPLSIFYPAPRQRRSPQCPAGSVPGCQTSPHTSSSVRPNPPCAAKRSPGLSHCSRSPPAARWWLRQGSLERPCPRFSADDPFGSSKVCLAAAFYTRWAFAPAQPLHCAPCAWVWGSFFPPGSSTGKFVFLKTPARPVPMPASAAHCAPSVRLCSPRWPPAFHPKISPGR